MEKGRMCVRKELWKGGREVGKGEGKGNKVMGRIKEMG